MNIVSILLLALIIVVIAAPYLLLAYLIASLASYYGYIKFGLNGLLALIAGAGIALLIFSSFSDVLVGYFSAGVLVFMLKVFYEYGSLSRLEAKLSHD